MLTKAAVRRDIWEIFTDRTEVSLIPGGLNVSEIDWQVIAAHKETSGQLLLDRLEDLDFVEDIHRFRECLKNQASGFCY